MKLEVYNDVPKKDETVRLQLIKRDTGVAIIAVDGSGTRLTQGFMAEINENGIRLCASFNKDLGFAMDGTKIKIRG